VEPGGSPASSGTDQSAKAKGAGVEDMPGMKISVDDNSFGVILNCAVRYSIGRQTYMPGFVVGFITPLLPHVSDRTLHVLDQDITEQKYLGGYGDPKIDEPVWMRFHEAIRTEEARRGLEPYKDWRSDNGT